MNRTYATNYKTYTAWEWRDLLRKANAETNLASAGRSLRDAVKAIRGSAGYAYAGNDDEKAQELRVLANALEAWVKEFAATGFLPEEG